MNTHTLSARAHSLERAGQRLSALRCLDDAAFLAERGHDLMVERYLAAELLAQSVAKFAEAKRLCSCIDAPASARRALRSAGTAEDGTSVTAHMFLHAQRLVEKSELAFIKEKH